VHSSVCHKRGSWLKETTWPPPIMALSKGLDSKDRAAVNSFNLNGLALLVLVCWLGIGASAGQAQQMANLPADLDTRPLPNLVSGSSPITFFRQLLVMDDNERTRVLTGRSESQRKLILAKVDEYEALTPEERELRLRVLELRYYLQPLMQSARTNRTIRLQSLPPDIRKLVDERLTQWDLLPPGLQQEVLEGETTRNYFIRLEASSPAQREIILRSLPASRRQELEEGFARWQILTPDQKNQTYKRLNRFFELTDEEQEKTLRTLSEPERKQMQKVLIQFENLPVENRRYCLQAFYKFASLSPVEKELFLKSAERWQAMSPSERQAWRDLVTKLPPLPPGVQPFAAPPLPPR
jgi:hypothetical protein